MAMRALSIVDQHVAELLACIRAASPPLAELVNAVLPDILEGAIRVVREEARQVREPEHGAWRPARLR
jgi:hypothetical protein